LPPGSTPSELVPGSSLSLKGYAEPVPSFVLTPAAAG
jgi:hypothetical protein